MVRDLARLGDGVVDTARGVVLVPAAFPGDRVRLADVQKRGGVLRGRLAEVVSPSPDRREPVCPLVERCGGCPWMAFDLARQREAKRRFVSEAAGIEAALEPIGAEVGYRRRARLAFGRGRIGYHARRSRGVVDVASCAVLSPALDAALGRIRDALGPRLAGEGELSLALGEGRGAVVALSSAEPQPPVLYDAARALVDEGVIAGVSLAVGGAGAPATFGDPREVSLGGDGLPLVGPPGGFSQAQDEVNRALAARVLELAEPDGARVLELYAGHGNLSVRLAARARELVAVEQDAAAAEALRQNLEARGLGAKERGGGTTRVVTADAAADASLPRADVVVLDPPRSGARDALAGIAARRPQRIVYVSCDPATLGRDVRMLRTLGYAPDRAHAFDMFPQTAHVEAVVRLVEHGAGRSGRPD